MRLSDKALAMICSEFQFGKYDMQLQWLFNLLNSKDERVVVRIYKFIHGRNQVASIRRVFVQSWIYAEGPENDA